MRIALALALVAVQAGAALAQAPAEAPLTLAQIEQLALANNPTALAARAAVDATRARAEQAGAMPNPVFGYTGMELTRGRERDRHGAFVEQMIPLGGRLGAQRDVLRRAADRADALVELQRQRILGSVRSLFYETLATERQVEVHTRLAALTSEAVGVTAQLFNVGAADRPDHLEIEIESLRIQLGLEAARNHLFAVRQRLAAAVGRPDVATRRLDGSIDAPVSELERETILRTLLETSPQMRAARADLERARAATALARKQTSPNLFLRGGALYNREPDVSGGPPIGWQGDVEAGISVPLFDRNRNGVAAARADESRAEAEIRRLELSLRALAAAQFATYLTALREGEVYRTQILPRADEAYRLYVDRYRAMAAAYPQVLVAQQTLFTISREYLQSLDRLWQSASSLQSLLAGDALMAVGGGDDGGSTPTVER